MPPIKEKLLTVPRFELQAAVLACRMKATILEEIKLQVTTVFLWYDSKTVINYINDKKANFEVFIAHRVNEIGNSSNTEEWFYVLTKENVADDLTSYKGFDTLYNRSRWCVGPDFLYKEDASESLSINSMANNKQDDTVLPGGITNEHLENKETKVTNCTSKKQSNLASKIRWGRNPSFFTLTCHVAWIIKL